MQQQTPITLPIIRLHTPHLHGPIPHQLLHPLQRSRNRHRIILQTPHPRRQRHPYRMPLLQILEHVVRLPFQIVIGDARAEFEFLEGSIGDGASAL